jgi:hypothetical protein
MAVTSELLGATDTGEYVLAERAFGNGKETLLVVLG